jgi:hypothetical protein
MRFRLGVTPLRVKFSLKLSPGRQTRHWFGTRINVSVCRVDAVLLFQKLGNISRNLRLRMTTQHRGYISRLECLE